MHYKKIIFVLALAWMLALPLVSFAAEEGIPILQRRGLYSCLITGEICTPSGIDDKTCLKVGSTGYVVTADGKVLAPGSCSVEDILIFASSIIDWMVAIAGAVALFMFVIGGSWMIFSAGNSSRVERGKDILTGTTIALMFILGSWVIVQFVLQGLGSNIQLTGLECSSKDPTCPPNTTCTEKNRCEDKCAIQYGEKGWSCQSAPTQGGCVPNICRNQADVCCPPLTN